MTLPVQNDWIPDNHKIKYKNFYAIQNIKQDIKI